MPGRQQLFENGKDRRGNVIPADVAAIKKDKANAWAKAFVKTESGVFAFSDVETAQHFAGDVANVIV